jgi:hypothetical protein
MLRAVYRQFTRFLNRLNGISRPVTDSARAVREAVNHRRDIETRSGSSGDGLGL